MAHFVVYVTEKRKRKAVVDVVARNLDIGARSTCALTVQDPFAAERHCAIEFDARRGNYAVRDLGSTTGTYLNGVRVGPATTITSGDVVVLGTMRLSASIEMENGQPALHLELQEKAFQFQKAEFVRKTGDWIQGDRERWIESEVTFSRFPALRWVVWGSVLLVGLGPLLLVNSSLRAKTFEPGPLNSAHAALFDGSEPLLARHAAIAAKGCQACHEPLKGIPISACDACHPSTRDSHPFQDSGQLAAGAPNSCIECHVDHEGGEADALEYVAMSGAWSGHSAAVPSRTGNFVPKAGAMLCERCHPGLSFDEAKKERLLASIRPPENDTRTVKVPYDTFSHADHLSTAIDCKTCHLPSPERSPDRRDFVPMQFEGCMGCHGDTDLDPALRTEVARGDWSAESPAFPLTWHGALDDTSHCQACHAETYDKAIRTVTREEFHYVGPDGRPIPLQADDPRLLFAYSTRRHTDQFEAALASLGIPPSHPDDNCASCHLDGDWIRTGEAREGRFYHELHLAQLHQTAEVERLSADEAGQRLLAESAQGCSECHSMIMEANALAQPFYRAEEHSCVVCHRTREGDESAVPRLIDAPARMEREGATSQVHFPHDAHTNSDHPELRAGCYACHSFRPSEVAFRSPVVTPDSVKNCTQCHDADHANVGGGSCGKCHLPGDQVFSSRLSDTDWAPQKEWPALNTFNHFGAGHLPAVEASCDGCHPGIEQAQTISDVRLLSENDAVCRECHIEQYGRFHWR